MKHFIRALVAVSLLLGALLPGVSDTQAAKPRSQSDEPVSGAVKAAPRQSDTDKGQTTETTRLPGRDKTMDNSSPVTQPVQTAPAPVEPTVPWTTGTQATPAIQNDWISINHGGATEVTSGNLKMGISIAQPVAGYVTQGNLALGLGYWYGAAAGGGGGGCNCPWQGDYNEDGDINTLDLNGVIDIMFFAAPNIQDPDCPTYRMDFDCTGAVDALDLNAVIDHMFFAGPLPCDPCAP